jgi:hypothetical protein
MTKYLNDFVGPLWPLWHGFQWPSRPVAYQIFEKMYLLACKWPLMMASFIIYTIGLDTRSDAVHAW